MQADFARHTKTIARLLNVTADELNAGFRDATIDDLSAIIALRKESLGKSIRWDDEAYFRWRYFFSATSNAASTRNTIKLIEINQKIVGMIGVLEFDIQCINKTIPAAHTLDLLVESHMDGMGLGAWIILRIKHEYPFVIIIGANKNSESLVRRVFLPMPDRDIWKLPLKSRYLFSGHGVPNFISIFMGFFADISFRFYHNFLARQYQKNTPLEFRSITQFDSDANSLIESWNQSAVLHLRTADYLNWRFLACPGRDYQALGAYDNQQLCAYLVFSLRSEKTNRKIATIEDFFWKEALSSDSKRDTFLISLLLEFSKKMRAEGVTHISLSSYGTKPIASLKLIKFIARQGENLPFSLHIANPEHSPELTNPQYWFLTDADAHGGGH